MSLDRIVCLNEAKNHYAVYSDSPYGIGAYNTPMLFDGTLAMCVEWRRLDLIYRETFRHRNDEDELDEYQGWLETCLEACSGAVRGCAEQGHEVEQAYGVKLRNRDYIDDYETMQREIEERLQKMEARAKAAEAEGKPDPATDF